MSRYEAGNNKSGPTKTGNLGRLVKRAPRGGASVCRELCCDADIYQLEFPSEAEVGHRISATEKLTMLSAHLLLDYIMFEGDTGKCNCNDDGLTCNFFYCSIIGCLVPCSLFIPFNKNDD